MPADRELRRHLADAVVPLRREHVRAAASVLATSLADDPGYRYLLPDGSRRVGELAALYHLTLSDTVRHGLGFVTTIGPVVTGAIALYPPGAYPMTPARWVRSSPRVAWTAALARDHIGGLVRFGRQIAPGVPPDDWYFQAAGVRPDLQGAGRGTALLLAAIAVADEAGRPSHLETNRPENVDYYRRFGYELCGDLVPLAPDGPWIHPMERPVGGP